jgi:hypothetical protein
MFSGLLRIALLCLIGGVASIPLSFNINSSPIIVWLGNALGSLVSLVVVIYFAEHFQGGKYAGKPRKHWVSRKIITVLETDKDNKKVVKARIFINKHGLRVFSFFCPLFPGVLLSTAAIYLLDLDKSLYKKWVTAGIFFASGAYVFGYWFTFVR